MSALRLPTATELEVHRAIVEHLVWRKAEGCFAFHIPNGGYRTKAEAGIFKSLGVVSGVPDVMLLHEARLHGLELKKEGTGRLSPAQLAVHEALRKAGCEVATAYGVDAALDQLRQWGLLRG
jgi:hypothetical protein